MTQDCKYCILFENSLNTKSIVIHQFQLHKALYNKYSQSQDSHFLKTMNGLVEKKSIPYVIQFQDTICLLDEEEYIKRFYEKQYQNDRMKNLTEYYKYHKDIPRSFMLKESEVINGIQKYLDYHDKMRKINYYKIKLFLHKQNGNQNTFQMTSSSEDTSSNDDTLSNNKTLIKTFLNFFSNAGSYIESETSQLCQAFIVSCESMIKEKQQTFFILAENNSQFLFESHNLSIESVSSQEKTPPSVQKVKQINLNEKFVLRNAIHKSKPSQQYEDKPTVPLIERGKLVLKNEGKPSVKLKKNQSMGTFKNIDSIIKLYSNNLKTQRSTQKTKQQSNVPLQFKIKTNSERQFQLLPNNNQSTRHFQANIPTSALRNQPSFKNLHINLQQIGQNRYYIYISQSKEKPKMNTVRSRGNLVISKIDKKFQEEKQRYQDEKKKLSRPQSRNVKAETTKQMSVRPNFIQMYSNPIFQDKKPPNLKVQTERTRKEIQTDRSSKNPRFNQLKVNFY